MGNRDTTHQKDEWKETSMSFECCSSKTQSLHWQSTKAAWDRQGWITQHTNLYYVAYVSDSTMARRPLQHKMPSKGATTSPRVEKTVTSTVPDQGKNPAVGHLICKKPPRLKARQLYKERSIGKWVQKWRSLWCAEGKKKSTSSAFAMWCSLNVLNGNGALILISWMAMQKGR